MSRPTAVDNLEQRLQRKSHNINTNINNKIHKEIT
jgi:hypothetical protein